MMNDAQKLQGAVPRNGRGNGLLSLRTYMRIVSSGASTVASTVRSAGASVASSIAERYEEATRDQVIWAGFDKIECVGGVLRQALLLAYRHGFQVWDVEEADDVRQLAFKLDGPVSFLQIQKKPILFEKLDDRFAEFRPLLVVAGDVFFFGMENNVSGTNSYSENRGNDFSGDNQQPSVLRFFSLASNDYVHVLKFRSAIFSVRCSTRVVAISQSSQIHCFNAATLEREYTILTHPVASESLGYGSTGYGPLAVGPRWLAYSGTSVVIPDTSRIRPEHLAPAGSPSSPTGSAVANFAKESSKQLAAGIVTLGDMGYKKLSKYYLELLPDANGPAMAENFKYQSNGVHKGNFTNFDDIGMVIVRDIVSKAIIVQIKAHKSPISALCFDPSGTLLVTASIHGHNMNVFHILPSPCSNSPSITESGSSVHLFKLQRGITNAVIQDISFSDDSHWLMISSSRGTSHLFAISTPGETNIRLQNRAMDGSYISDIHHPRRSGSSQFNRSNPYSGPVTLSVASRIKNGNSALKGAVTGAAAAAMGKSNPISGAIASTFHNSSRTKYYLLLFASSGCIIQYVLRRLSGDDSSTHPSISSTPISHELSPESDTRFVVEPLQKWDICSKRSRRERIDGTDTHGEHGNVCENAKLFQKTSKKSNSVYPSDCSGGKLKLAGEENNHLYISAVELQMYSAQAPLWSRSGISFQAMMDENSSSSGEFEIEKLFYRSIEARSVDLKPVLESDYRQIRSDNGNDGFMQKEEAQPCE